MRLTALVEHPAHVCCRYRLTAFQPFLERAGHTLELRPRPRRFWDWLGLARSLRDSHAVILQRKLLRRWQLYLLRRAAKVLIFDIDDAVYLRDSFARKGLHCPRRLASFSRVCQAADAVVAGNAFLAAETSRWTDPACVHVIPTCVDPGLYPSSVAEVARLPSSAGTLASSATVQLVWVGSRSTLQGLEHLRPTLEQLGQRNANLELKLVCDEFLSLKHLSVLRCLWSEASEAAEIAAADIGISWIPDDDWSRGKCGLKVLQYMAAGLPVVANAVGVHAEMIRHGETGFVIQTAAEWRDAILTLAADSALRQRMGQAARRRLEATYSVQQGGERWLAALARFQLHTKVA